MKKKFIQYDYSFSYLNNRECRHCGRPIADQEHKTREFCPVNVGENGKIRDCKSAFHRENDKPYRVLQTAIIADQKTMAIRIDFLIKMRGHEVTTDDLDFYEIDLRKPVSYNVSTDGLMTSYFLYHTIVSDPNTNNHKISHHGI
jgi:predicted RNA-binding Zn-ribbon protein involved in translation (DUF1610 family)